MTDLVTIGFAADTRQVKTAERDLNNLAAAGQKVDSNVSALSKTIGILGTALAALGSAQLARELVAQSDAWKGITSQLRQVTSSEKELADQRKVLIELSKDTRSELGATVDLYSALSRSTKDLGLSQMQLTEITGTINNLFLASGKSAIESAGAIRQLSQALASGALRGDEFNSVSENAPLIMDALTEKLRMTRGELREFAATGGITAQILTEALQDYGDKAQEMADKTEKTFGQAMVNAGTNVAEFVGSLESVNVIITAAGDGIEYASENIDALARAVGAAAAVMATAMLPALYKTSAGFVAATVESVRYQIALARMAGVSTTAALATTALGSAVKLALGPIGLVIAIVGTAALTFNSYAAETELAKKSSAELKMEIEELSGSMDKLTKAQAALLQVKISERMEQIEARLSQMSLAAGATSEELQALFGDRFKNAVVESAAATDALTQEMSRLKTQSAELSAIINSGSAPAIVRLTKEQKEAAKAAEKVRESFADQVVALELQRQQLLLTADEYELLQAKMEAIAYGASPAMVAAIENQVKSLQKVRKVTEGIDKVLDGGLFGFKDDVEEVATISEKAAERIEGAFADAWLNAFDGLKSVIDGMKNAFKRMLAELIHMATTNKIMLSLGLGGFSGAASAATGAAAGGGIAGLLGGGIAGLGGMIGGSFGAGLGSTGALLGTGTMAGLTGAFANIGGLFSSGSYMAAAGAAMPLIAGAVVAAMGINKLTGGNLFGTSWKQDNASLNLGFSNGDLYGNTQVDYSKKKSLFRGTERRSEITKIAVDEIDAIFDGVKDGIVKAAEVFGITGRSGMAIADWVNTLTASVKISTTGKNEQEIQQAISDWVQSTSSFWVDSLFGGMLDGLKNEGETSAQALDRLILNFGAVESITSTLGLNFSMMGVEAVKAATNIVELAGGLDALNALTTQYYQNFYTEAERAAVLGGQLNDAFSDLGVTMPTTNAGFRALVESLDLSTEAGQKMFAELMRLVPSMAEYLKYLEAQTGALTDYEGAARAAFEMLKKSVDVEKSRAKAIYDASQETYRAEVERIEGVKRAIDQVYETLQSNLTNAAGLLTRSLAAESQRIESEYNALQDRLSGAEGALSASFDAEKSAIQSASDLRIEALNMESDAVKAAAAKRIESLGAEAEMARKVASDLRQLQEQFSINTVTVEQALKAARRGDFSLAQNLNVSEVSASNFGSAEEFKAAQAMQAGRLNEIGQLAGSRATAAERTAAAAERQILAIQSASDAQIDLISKQIEEEKRSAEQQIASLDKQLNELLGINTTALNLQDAIKQYQDAQKALADFDIDTQRERLAEQQKQADLLMGIDNSVVSVAEAIAAYQQAQLALDEFNYEGQISALDAQLATAESMLSLAEKAYQDEIARLDAIILDGENQLNALLGIDTSIMSLTDAVNNFNSSITALAESMRPQTVAPAQEKEVEMALRDELRQERELNAAALRAIAKSSERTSNILQRIELNSEAEQLA